MRFCSAKRGTRNCPQYRRKKCDSRDFACWRMARCSRNEGSFSFSSLIDEEESNEVTINRRKSMSIRLNSLAVGMATYVPGLWHLTGRKTGGSASARYCYSVWLRHLSMLHESALPTMFETTAELGPGDSLGIGLATMLS